MLVLAETKSASSMTFVSFSPGREFPRKMPCKGTLRLALVDSISALESNGPLGLSIKLSLAVQLLTRKSETLHSVISHSFRVNVKSNFQVLVLSGRSESPSISLALHPSLKYHLLTHRLDKFQSG